MDMSTAIVCACQALPPGMPWLQPAIPANHDPHGAKLTFHPPVSIDLALIRCNRTWRKSAKRTPEQHLSLRQQPLSCVPGHSLRRRLQISRRKACCKPRSANSIEPTGWRSSPWRAMTEIDVRDSCSGQQGPSEFRRWRASGEDLRASIGESRQISSRRPSRNFSTAFSLKSELGAGPILTEFKHSGQRIGARNMSGSA